MLTGIAQAAALPYVKIITEQKSEGKPLSILILRERLFFTGIKWLERLLKRKQEAFYG